MTDQPPADRDDAVESSVDAGAFIGREDEVTRKEISTTGEAMQDANPDPGWADDPAGHRQASRVDDDDLKRKG